MCRVVNAEPSGYSLTVISSASRLGLARLASRTSVNHSQPGNSMPASCHSNSSRKINLSEIRRISRLSYAFVTKFNRTVLGSRGT